jgi:hypothetical protein
MRWSAAHLELLGGRGSMAVSSVHLRQRGSPASKPVGVAQAETGRVAASTCRQLDVADPGATLRR